VTASGPVPARREAILEAALELFAERGFHGTTVPSVAEQAGVGAGTLYRYFESKESLVNALYQKWKQTLGAALMKGFPAAEPPRKQFAHMWKCLTAFAARHPKVMVFLELHHHGAYLDQTSRNLEEAVRAPAVAMVRHAQAQCVLKDLPPDLLIAIVHGAFVGILRAAREGHLAMSRENLEAAEACAWEAVRR
jgi:AcrR family transcriptional regulator